LDAVGAGRDDQRVDHRQSNREESAGAQKLRELEGVVSMRESAANLATAGE
jgi:hypothetical protein